MTAPQPGGADRSSRADRDRSAGSVASALVLLLLGGLVLRLSIAYLIFPGSGFATDIGTFTAWSLILAEHGPGSFYEVSSFADYPPAYLYVLWLVGGLGHLLAPLADGNAAGVVGGLIKLPPMLADIAVGYLLYRILRGWAGARRDAERLGLAAAALYVFNPVTWYDSALWGQTDAIGALVVLLTVAALVRGNSEGAAVLTVLAALVKPQFGIVLVPVVGAVLLHRHVLAIGTGPRAWPLLPAGLATVRDWFAREQGPIRLFTSAAAGLVILPLVLTPFDLDIVGFAELMMGTAGGYPWLSVNAYNPWALLGSQGQAPLAEGGGWSSDTASLFGPLPGVVAGALLLAGGFLLVALRLSWRADRRSIVIGAIVVALAFFVLPTRVHERYMFPIFVLLPLLAVVDRRWLAATVVLSVAAFINMHAVLTTPIDGYATPNIRQLPLGQLFRDPAGVYTSVLLHTAGFAFMCWRLLPRFAGQPDPYAAVVPEPAKDEPAVAAPAPATVTNGWRIPHGLRRALEVIPLRRDRSTALATERGGRLDRLDLLAVLLVFVAALGLRTVNLSQPHAMHFDEVYHARTGTEFLQHWRYGMPHSIYEYTHPHLAKYAMAAGIVVLGNNRVVATSEVGPAVNAAVLERRWDEEGPARRGDRAYVATPDGVRAIDLATGETVATLPIEVPALAVDDGGHMLYLADVEGGLWELPTAALDALRGDRDAVPPAPEEVVRLTLDGRPQELFFAAGRLIVLAEDNVLVSVDPLSGAELARTTVDGAAAVIAIGGDEGELLAVGGSEGITLRNADDLGIAQTLPTDEPVTGMALVEEGVDESRIYAATGSSLQIARVGGDETPALVDRVDMPGTLRDVYANPSTALVHVLGDTPDGSASTLYVVEPHSNAVFADAVLPFAPRDVLMDVQPRRPADDRLNALAIGAGGEQATVDVGSNTFAWRFPGVLAGALMAACIYLLGRFLFRRRSVAIIAALLVLADGMAFANARIAMNDTYVALFITAAFTLFAPLYMGRWRSPLAVAAAVVGVAALLGLALASKWVGAYALGGIGLLILLRSALGRLIALLAMLAMTGVLGYMAIAPGPEATQINVLFLGLMVLLTTLLAVAMVIRPLAFTRDELRLAVVGPLLLGGLAIAAGAWLALTGASEVLGGLLTPGRLLFVGAALVAVSPAAWLIARLAARYGRGPLATGEQTVDTVAPSALNEPPPRGWLRPGSGVLGLPWLAALGTLALVPLLIYALSYVPWIELGNRWTTDFPAGAGGQTFLDLQKSMYDYHNDLRATHAASSPWWAWPLDLKPVWFYQHDFAGQTTGVIYNTGNMVIFWLAIPAVAFAAFQAWRRRSLALAVLVFAVAALWLPWARIDRATFQYHVFTALPFAVLCLAYFLAELWHGPSRRTWMLARVAAALAILLPALLWLLRLPLCAIGRVDQLNAGAEVCQVSLERSIALTDLQVLGVIAAVAGLIAVGVLLGVTDDLGRPLAERRRLALPAAVAVAGTGALLVAGGAFLAGTRTFLLPVDATLISLVFLFLLAVPAWFVLRARDPRRYTVGALVAAGLWFVVWYPNISGLPVPNLIAHAHLIVLPTLNYSFQFGVNLDPPGAGIDWLGVTALSMVMALLAAAAAYAALAWRADRAESVSLRTLEEPG